MQTKIAKSIALVVFGAWLVNIVQISVLPYIGLFGGQPHLIAILLIIFLATENFNMGLVWIAFGAGYFDILLGMPGITTIPLLLGYITAYSLGRNFFNTLPWLALIILGLLLLIISELVLVFVFGNWPQLFKDVALGLVLLIPLSYYIKENIGNKDKYILKDLK